MLLLGCRRGRSEWVLAGAGRGLSLAERAGLVLPQDWQQSLQAMPRVPWAESSRGWCCSLGAFC